MRILVLGSGAREHAILLALKGEGGHQLFAAPGNAGIAADATLVPGLDANDPGAVTDYANDETIDLVIIGPEAPLVAGVADALRERGIPVFGPGRAAAALEGSKAFAKRIMDAAGVPTGRAARAATRSEVETALDAYGAPYVVKADGLAAGKGVIVTDDRAAALAHADAFLGAGPVLVEEFLSGPEVSLFFVSDGDTVRALSPAQDFKRAYDGDAGPNTGGMGAYSPLPWVGEDFVQQITDTVALPTVRQLEAEGTPFVGLLYCGLIVTAAGTRVIEFNARFGDPETQVVLPRMTSALSEYLLAAAEGRLDELPDPSFSDDVAGVVVLASEGYPGEVTTGREVIGISDNGELASAPEQTHLVHAATARDEAGRWIATGGRVLGVVARGESFAKARDRAYAGIGSLSLEGGQHRSDIAERVA